MLSRAFLYHYQALKPKRAKAGESINCQTKKQRTMKKIFYALSLAVALLTTSCAKDATEDILNGGNSNSSDVATTTITVGIDNATRVHLGDENDIHMPLQ